MKLTRDTLVLAAAALLLTAGVVRRRRFQPQRIPRTPRRVSDRNSLGSHAIARGRPGRAPLLLRSFLVVLFPFSSMDKVIHWDSAMKQAGDIPFKRAMLVASIVVECIAPACIVAGKRDRLAAFTLGGFCVMTAVLFHRFWRFPGFWRLEEGEGLQHFWEFLKNFGLAGGLGLLGRERSFITRLPGRISQARVPAGHRRATSPTRRDPPA